MSVCEFGELIFAHDMALAVVSNHLQQISSKIQVTFSMKFQMGQMYLTCILCDQISDLENPVRDCPGYFGWCIRFRRVCYGLHRHVVLQNQTLTCFVVCLFAMSTLFFSLDLFQDTDLRLCSASKLPFVLLRGLFSYSLSRGELSPFQICRILAFSIERLHRRQPSHSF